MSANSFVSVSPDHCFHCGLPLNRGINIKVEIEGEPRDMCCHGCAAVASAIIAGGHAGYYRHRTEHAPGARELVPDILRQASIYDNPEVQKSFVRRLQGEAREADLILEGIVCAACVWLNERHLRALPGVLDVQVNYTTHRAHLKWDAGRIKLSEIIAAISAIGYIAHPYDPGRQQELLEKERRVQLRRLGLAGVLGMQVMMIAVALYAGAFSGMEDNFRHFFQWISLGLALPVLLYSGRPFFLGAWRDLRNLRAGMDVPVALGISIAFLGSLQATVTGRGEVYFDSVVMFIFFLLAGRYFELVARKRAAEASESLTHGLPAMATRMSDVGAERREELVTVADLRAGERVLVRPGETIPADGRIVEGRSSVDEALLTGESMPRGRAGGDEVLGGAINVESPLVIELTRPSEESVLSSIMRLVDRVQAEKPRITELADRTAAWFVGAVILLAAGVAAYWWRAAPGDWLPITVAVLVVTCPCALSLATPTALSAATGRLTRNGLLLTRGHALEALARATHFVFDKTGTLTEGKPRLLATRVLAELGEQQALRLAASIEASSEHPLARALVAAWEKNVKETDGSAELSPCEAVENLPGEGISGLIAGRRYWVGNPDYVERMAGLSLPDTVRAQAKRQARTLVVLAGEEGPLAAFFLGDAVREGVAALVADLRADGIQVCLLSGDHQAAARALAAEVGIEHVHGDLKPEDKLTHLRRLQSEGAVVAMIGDGVNDAPVLAAAQVSVAMGGGTRLAAVTADMILLSDQIGKLSHARGLAVSTFRVIRQNLFWALAYNLSALPAAALGWVAPWMAAIGMSASSLLVVGNALRLLRRERSGDDASNSRWR